MLKRIRSFLIAAPLLFTADAGIALDDEGGCVHNRSVYPEGSELCRSGTLVRCEESAWSDIGFCKDEPRHQPKSGGGDAVVQPEQ
ncbi:MAG: hypothetical protein QF890_00515 [Myxococcota bacterium]|jgi:hypothetical protein|nr:hypothetical protein [Deltaproteobacteria bacterium]MCP4239916.1 hypothetical protein [bacterium]MDP6242939.1 hypothetical protein [Myxococcota bacterium]MDP7076589.1 hypothetical protein [Myxococcota bacterium]MDP7298328.1 hypothetical protein [Myxococcota bacterium]